MKRPTPQRDPDATRQRLLEAARDLILAQGFSATGIQQICRQAGVSKGAFFHHFSSKDDLCQVVLAGWTDFGLGIFRQASAAPARYPLERVHRFLDILIGVIRQAPGPTTCVLGIVAQETALASPVLAAACSGHFAEWTDYARELLEEARAAQPPRIDFDPEALAWFLNSVWQGSMLIAKARRDPEMIVRNLERARAHIDNLFGEAAARPRPTETA
jgi:TetR/AcrR family transcriptional repressor of nem operon